MVNVGIIGAGRIGQVHLRSIATGVPAAKVVAISDPYMSDAAKALAEGFGAKAIVGNYDAIINDPTIDTVIICTPTTQHVEVALAAINAGKNVFCEKPVDQDLAKIEEVKTALKNAKKPVKFMVGFNRRFDHNYAAMRNAVETGKIGEVQFVHISSRDPEPPNPKYVASSGGMFLDMMIHDLDMVHFLAGSDVEELYAKGACLVDPEIGKAGDVDTVTISLKMKNGALATIDGSRKAVYGYDQRGEVFGSKGAVETKNDAASTVVFSGVDGIISEKPLYFFLERYMGSYQEEMRQFIDCIVNNTKEPADIEDGIQSVKLANACALSMKENRPVKISEIK